MSEKVFIIAEAGVNHNGSLAIAKKMVDAAVLAGADAVKFQTFKTENLASVFAPKAYYQTRTTPVHESQAEMLKRLELDGCAHKELKSYCRQKNILFLSSPFDLESIDFLNDLGLEIFKVPSGEITNLPYLRKVGRLGKRVFLSTGMSDLSEAQAALDVLVASGTSKENIVLLHCTTDYPAAAADVNLRAMVTLGKSLGVAVGYSDHTCGIEVSVAAVALGAVVIEKHFTLDKTMSGPDHEASLGAGELANLVKSLRNVENALGSGIKVCSQSEIANKDVVRKSIVAARAIKKGECFSDDNIVAKRPGTGIDPMRWDMLLGKRAVRDFKKDELIEV